MSNVLDTLPPHVRKELTARLAKLPADWQPHEVRFEEGGWDITFHDSAGKFAATLTFMEDWMEE